MEASGTTAQKRIARFQRVVASSCNRSPIWIFCDGTFGVPHLYRRSSHSGASRRPRPAAPLYRARYPGRPTTFLKNGLMEYGSIFGHGAYLGPDYTADYLRRSATSVMAGYTRRGSDRAREATA